MQVQATARTCILKRIPVEFTEDSQEIPASTHLTLQRGLLNCRRAPARPQVDLINSYSKYPPSPRQALCKPDQASQKKEKQGTEQNMLSSESTSRITPCCRAKQAKTCTRHSKNIPCILHICKEKHKMCKVPFLVTVDTFWVPIRLQ